MRWILVATTLAACGRSGHSGHAPASSPTPGPSMTPTGIALIDPDLQLLVTPAPDHAPFVQAIDGARLRIDLAMFHLTDTSIAEALGRAHARGVAVRVILDGSSLRTRKLDKIAAALRDAGVDVRGSTPAFTITHEKAMVVDGAVVFITAINLTKDVGKTRDLGVVTHAPQIAAEVERVFEQDWQNAANQTGDTPPLTEPSLVWSPINSRAKLTALVGSATHTLELTVENLGDPAIGDALAAAEGRHVAVRVIVPMCDKNPNPLANFKPAGKLAAAGVDVRMMPAPESADQPYMHSKMILADGTTAYVGSVNFSINSTSKARELGIIFANPAAAATIAATFAHDWERAVPIPSSPPDCGSSE